jgi:hypothetical protein
MNNCLSTCSTNINILTNECVATIDTSIGFGFTYQGINYIATCLKASKFLFFDVVAGNSQCLSNIATNCDTTQYHVFGTVMCAALLCSNAPTLFPNNILGSYIYDNANICSASCPAGQFVFANNTCTSCTSSSLFRSGSTCSLTRPSSCLLYTLVSGQPNVCVSSCSAFV